MKALVFLMLWVVLVFSKSTLRITITDKHGAYGSDEELVNIDVKPANTSGADAIKTQVKLYFHLVNNQVHCNGVPLKHERVTHLHMQMTLEEINDGEKIKNKRDVPVELRVLVGDQLVNSKQVVFVEQQMLMIDQQNVTQTTTQKATWEELVKKPTISLEFVNTRLSREDEKEDRQVYVKRHPDDDNDEHDKPNKHQADKHQADNNPDKDSQDYWWTSLNKPSKIAYVFGVIITSVAAVLAIVCLFKFGFVNRPIPDASVSADINEKKEKIDEEKIDIHFEMDKTVVVNDKKVLIE